MRAYRQFLMLMALVSLLCLLAARLFYLQMPSVSETFGGKSKLVRMSVSQRRASIVLDDGRGRILDRSGTPLAGIETKALLVLPSDSGLLSEQMRRKIAEIVGVPEREWNNCFADEQLPALWMRRGEKDADGLDDRQAAQLERLGLPNLKVVPYVRRYPETPVGEHLIGFTAQNPQVLDSLYADQIRQGRLRLNEPLGMSGLERTFERFLQARGKTKYVAYIDGQSKPLAGLNERYAFSDNAYYPLKLLTTMDGELQRKIETLMDRRQVRDGAVVVLDASNGDIAAMASKPDYNPYSVKPEKGDWRNRGVMPDVPGSTFKTVVAAAALEEGVVHPGDRFQCTGEWREQHLRCWLREGHGTITLEQAFAQSCNVTFAKLAVRLGPERLMKTAERLGIGRTVGWSADVLDTPTGEIRDFHQLDGELPGQLFDSRTNRKDPGVMAQTGIGQRDVRMSPLQAANLTATIVNDGRAVEPRAVSEVRMSNDHTLVTFPVRTRTHQAISGRTARWLKKAMRLTVLDGTGAVLADVPGGAGGKTGTAQTGVSGSVHYWFIGYAPADDPQYTFAVLVRNRTSGERHQALLVAEDLARLLVSHKKDSDPAL